MRQLTTKQEVDDALIAFNLVTILATTRQLTPEELHEMSELSAALDDVEQRKKSVLSRLELLSSGFAGVISGGAIVDRRDNPTASPIPRNKEYNVPAPLPLTGIVFDFYISATELDVKRTTARTFFDSTGGRQLTSDLRDILTASYFKDKLFTRAVKTLYVPTEYDDYRLVGSGTMAACTFEGFWHQVTTV